MRRGQEHLMIDLSDVAVEDPYEEPGETEDINVEPFSESISLGAFILDLSPISHLPIEVVVLTIIGEIRIHESLKV